MSCRIVWATLFALLTVDDADGETGHASRAMSCSDTATILVVIVPIEDMDNGSISITPVLPIVAQDLFRAGQLGRFAGDAIGDLEALVAPFLW